MKNILVIGSTGQIGSELTRELRNIYGGSHVVAGYIAGHEPKGELRDGGPMALADVTRPEDIARVVERYDVDTVYNLAALLSVVAEQKPLLAWKIGIDGLLGVLEVAREHGCAVFTPSSIGSFGPTTPQEHTPQDTIQRPKTIYGISKVTTELLSDYYYNKYGVDTRSVRFPGIISHVTLPGGGTTDYAVDIYYHAVRGDRFVCPLKPGMSFAPETIYEEIRRHLPGFEMVYQPDPLKQSIADSWPNSLDDTCAQREWNWKPRYDLAMTTEDMLENLKRKQ